VADAVNVTGVQLDGLLGCLVSELTVSDGRDTLIDQLYDADPPLALSFTNKATEYVAAVPNV
jgi:hypothetical protein